MKFTRRFAIVPDAVVGGIWRPRSVGQGEQPNLPRCMRCSARTGQTVPIEAYRIEDEGDGRIDVLGRCRGTCDNPQGEPTEHPTTASGDNWHDVVRITWDKYSDARTPEMLGRDLLKQIAAIRFFDELQEIAA